MATITIEIDINAKGNVSLSPNPNTVEDGDVVRWHVTRNDYGAGTLELKLPPEVGSPFGNRNELLGSRISEPGYGNAIDLPENPISWPKNVDSYSYDVEFSGGSENSSVRATLLRRKAPTVEFSKALEEVREIYVVDTLPILGPNTPLSCFRKVFPLPWWKRICWWRHNIQCCGKCHSVCCCCCKAPSGPVIISQPPAVIGPPTILLTQGTLAIGGMFYLFITALGQRCQFVVEWVASGGVGQLIVDLEVQEPGSPGFRTLATGLGPNDQYVYTGQRASYLFRARVTDARGQSTFDTLSVTCP